MYMHSELKINNYLELKVKQILYRIEDNKLVMILLFQEEVTEASTKMSKSRAFIHLCLLGNFEIKLDIKDIILNSNTYKPKVRHITLDEDDLTYYINLDLNQIESQVVQKTFIALNITTYDTPILILSEKDYHTIKEYRKKMLILNRIEKL